MPNGTSAPGKSSAAFDVPMNGLTSDAGEVTSAGSAAGPAPAASAGSAAAAPATVRAAATNRDREPSL